MREAQRVLRDPSDAEDAAQEAILRIWRAGQEEPNAAWLATVTRNEALRLLGRRQNHPTPLDPGSGVLQGIHDWESDSLDAVAVSQLLHSLEKQERALMRMRYIEDLTQPEIARRLGMPEGTVKVRLHRLRKQLRETTEGDLL